MAPLPHPDPLVPPFHQLHLPDADVTYLQSLDLGASPETILTALIGEIPWRQESVTLWGKTYKQPRLIAWYGDPGRVYRYSGLELEPRPWTSLLSTIKATVETAVGHGFNSVLLNYYRNQDDSMGFHSDDEKELGPTPIIASLSLGAERVFEFKSRHQPRANPIRLTLASGSLLLMQGDTQRNYKHGLPKQARPSGPRVNLTFRTIIL